jgi:thyroglobulin
VVDGQYLRELPSRRLKRPLPVKVDLLIGGSQDDGLINRAKAVKVGKGRQGEASAASCWILGRERLFPWLTEDCVPRL